ncbi:carbonic anhydrase [Vibrio gazogenes]|uniref:Carbonic anhydrase n=1 Tax=Vibrio gazogenes DSM 21264 = NBRC 103151 TaxID=1123492 RepID=A0A1M4SNT8_VIBGA|nr:carbonic anhydrase family protein [Vibrio gazogenes]USP15912.1 carbonic anhydrase family protein [Vibrio gazogenes]SHE33856.1 carbonic anhydrase [Vibrio gazogenes DSM 21264] [Vibrio gazogenes DSM 21264 = NBRC 103151]
MKKIILAMSVGALFSTMTQASEWGYIGENGPKHWGHVSKICETGKNQSPINLTDTVTSELKPLAVDYQGEVTSLTNNGHTLQATVTGHNTLTVDGKHFELKQFHFHTPSENLIKSHQYPLEAHFVNQDGDGNLAVIAVMFDIGAANPALALLAQKLPEKGDAVPVSFPVKDLLPATQKYYRFNGSLTTPPCSEGVRWFVMKQAKTLSTQQENELTSAMGHNNRPVQARNARVVLDEK